MAKKFDFAKIGIKAAGVGAGVIISKAAGNMLLKDKSPKLVGALKLVAGAIIPEFTKSPFLNDVGTGMMADGVGQIVSDLGIEQLAGIGKMDPLDDSLNGAEEDGDDDPIEGTEDYNNAMTGVDEDDSY